VPGTKETIDGWIDEMIVIQPVIPSETPNGS